MQCKSGSLHGPTNSDQHRPTHALWYSHKIMWRNIKLICGPKIGHLIIGVEFRTDCTEFRNSLYKSDCGLTSHPSLGRGSYSILYMCLHAHMLFSDFTLKITPTIFNRSPHHLPPISMNQAAQLDCTIATMIPQYQFLVYELLTLIPPK